METKKDIQIEGLKNEIEFWKNQFFKLAEIICDTKKHTEDTIDRINKIFGY